MVSTTSANAKTGELDPKTFERFERDLIAELAPLKGDSSAFLARLELRKDELKARYGGQGVQIAAGALLEASMPDDGSAAPEWVIEAYTKINEELPEMPRDLLRSFGIVPAAEQMHYHETPSAAFYDAAEAMEEADLDAARSHIEVCKKRAEKTGLAIPNAALMIEVRLDIHAGLLTKQNVASRISSLDTDAVKRIEQKVSEMLELGDEAAWNECTNIMLDEQRSSGNSARGIEAYTVGALQIITGRGK